MIEGPSKKVIRIPLGASLIFIPRKRQGRGQVRGRRSNKKSADVNYCIEWPLVIRFYCCGVGKNYDTSGAEASKPIDQAPATLIKRPNGLRAWSR